MSDISVVEEIANNIGDVRDTVMAMEFTKCIGELLKKNGVTPMISDYTSFSPSLSEFEIKCGVTIDGLDFSEHDKAFENEIAGLKAKIAIKDMDYKTASELLGKYQQENESLKQRIEEIAKDRDEWIDKAVEWKRKCEKLESKETSDLPFDPLECANYLINATYERETSSLERTFAKTPDKVNSDKYTVDDLEQIAEHLLVYCKHNKENECE